MAAPAPPPAVAAAIEHLVRLRHGARELTLLPRMTAGAGLAGNRRSSVRGRGMDFEEVRPYQPGDDIRSIDWRVTARTLTPHTKVFREERERPLVLLVDLRPNMFFGSRKLKSVTACEVAATLAWAGLNTGDRVGGLVFGPGEHRDVRARRDRRSVLLLLHYLSAASIALCARPSGSRPLSTILDDGRRVAHPGSTVAVISDFHDLDAACERHLFELARHCDVTLYQIYDDLERELPPAGWYAIRGAGGRIALNTAPTGQRAQFAADFRARRQHLQQLAARLGLGLLDFASDAPVLATLQQVYGKGRRCRPR